MREIEFGSPEHISGLSREALEADLRWMVGRNHELEGICERLDAENAKLRELLAELYEEQCDECDSWKYRDRMRELGVEVP